MEDFDQFNNREGETTTNGTGKKRERYQEIVKTTITELYGNARYWDFFKSFNEESVHDFIIEYASKKAWYVSNRERILAKKESEQFRYRDLAERCFWEIQQKKLFNLQAEWRAGLTELHGIEVTRDFLSWEKAITNCTLIDPVTVNDFELYCDYLRSGYYEEKPWIYNWQDFELFRNSESEELMPAWYRYYDMKRGTGYLQMLPDKRGIEEKMYLDAWSRKNTINVPEELMESELFSGTLPNLYMNYETMSFFIRTFESRNLLNVFEAAETISEDACKENEFQEAIRILSKAPEGTILPSADDWRDAVIKGAREYKMQMILSNLSVVYDDYLFRIQNGIAFNNTINSQMYNEYLENALIYKLKVNEGKKWLRAER